MSQISGFICFDVLAAADDFFKMIGPLLIFGVYIIAALAKGWTKSGQQNSQKEEEPSELRKAVQRRYQEIHQRQIGRDPGQGQPKRTAAHALRPVEPPVPVRQSSQRTYPLRPIPQKTHPRRNTHQKPISVKAQTPKSVQRPQIVQSDKVESTKPRRTEHSLASLIRQPQNLRTAIILKEILDKPLALRDF